MIDLFLNSCYSFDKYPRLMKTGWLKFILYFIMLTIVTFIFSLPYFYNSINDFIPEFTIADGKLNMDYKLDDEINGVKYLIDSNKVFTEKNLASYPNGIIVDSERVLTKNMGYIQQFSYKELELAGFTNKSITVKIFLIVSFVPFLFIYFFTSIFQLFFFVIILRMISFLMNVKLNYPEAIKLTLICRTFPEILMAFLLIFSVIMPIPVYFAMMTAYFYFAVKQLVPDKKSQPNSKSSTSD